MNTSKIVGALFFIVSGAWLAAVQAHPLVLLFLRGTRPYSAVTDPLRHFPFPPDYSARFNWETWWPIVFGFAGVAIGAVLTVASGAWRRDETETQIYRKERNREI